MGEAVTGDREPRTARGRATQRKILDAAAQEFGEKGFHESSIVSITRRAGVALGSFYTYYESKDELFRALVRDRSEGVRDAVSPAVTDMPPSLEREKVALQAFIEFARGHKELYRIIDEAEFVAPDAWRAHYEGTAKRIAERLRECAANGSVSGCTDEIEAWAIMGMNVFLGLRYGVMDDSISAAEVSERANALLRHGLGRQGQA